MSIPIAKEGRTMVLGGLAAAFSLLWVGGRWSRRLGLGILSAAAGTAFFFRDPERYVIPIENGVLAPADGKIIRIDTVEKPELSSEPLRMISIFMSVFDCHINRSPVDGRVKFKQRWDGSLLAAWDNRASEENRRAMLAIEGPVPCHVQQVAGLVARQIVTTPEVGDELVQGEKIGIIKFGSRVDVFFPTDLELLVDVGDRTIAGITALAERAVAPAEEPRKRKPAARRRKPKAE